MGNIVVIGQGYVGLPLAMAAARAGYAVIGLDCSPEVVETLTRGISHVDDISDAEVSDALRRGYTATTDPRVIAEAEVVLVCVPTPLDIDGGPDLGPVIAAGTEIGHHIRPGTLCVLQSTTYPGTTEEVFTPLVTQGRLTVGKDVFIAYSPERVDPGNCKYGLDNTPKVVGGTTAECLLRARDFFGKLVELVVEVRRPREAEMAKLIENTFRHVNIALVNEMARFSEQLDIDIWDALEAAATKPFGYMPFWPGPGVGGHCIPVDPSYLSHRVKSKLGYPFRMVEVAEEINQAAPHYVATRTWQRLNRDGIALNGATVLLLGVTYKSDISDVRESPAAAIAARLLSWGADLRYHDPFVPTWEVEGNHTLSSVTDPYEAARDADIAVLLQNHSAYSLDTLATLGTRILDTRGQVPKAASVERL